MYRTACVEVEGGPRLQCVSPPDLAIHPGDACIVDDGGLLEFGRVASLEDLADETQAARNRSRVLRRATLQDQSKAEENALMSKMGLKTCVAVAAKHDLKVRVIQGRYSFDRGVFRLLFSSEERLDVKDLVKELATELRARVDMKQIGVRDEAGLIGGVGPCGRALCCCTWLHRFESINVKMAKAQGLSLNPSAIGGCCGRLKCCLGYEADVYRELGRGVPAQGSRVECSDGKGCVVERNILEQRVKVRLDDERLLEYDAAAVKEIWTKKDRSRRPSHEDSGVERAESEPAGPA